MNFKLSAIEIIPLFSILLRPIERAFKLGVPWSPLAISATPNGPSPQFDINRDSKEPAELKKFKSAFAPKGLTALWLMSKCISLVFVKAIDMA